MLLTKKLRIAALCFLLIVFSPSAASDNIAIYVAVDNTCPYICLEGEPKGIFMDVLDTVLADSPYQIHPVKRPWKRAIADLYKGDIHILPAAEPVSFPDQTSLQATVLTEAVCIYAKESKRHSYQGMASLSQHAVGMMDYSHIVYPGNVYDEFFKQAKGANFYQIPALADGAELRLMRLLLSGRVDFLLLNRSVMRFNQQQGAIAAELTRIFEVGCLQPAMQLTYVLNRQSQLTPALQKHLQQGLNRLQESGQLQQILQRYLQPL